MPSSLGYIKYKHMSTILVLVSILWFSEAYVDLRFILNSVSTQPDDVMARGGMLPLRSSVCLYTTLSELTYPLIYEIKLQVA